MLDDQEVQRAERQLAEILQRHGLGWIVRRVDDALEAGAQPESGFVDELSRRRLVLLIEATRRTFAMASALERSVPELVLEEAGGRTLHIAPDPEADFDPRLRPPLAIDRGLAAGRDSEGARERLQLRLARLLREVGEATG